MNEESSVEDRERDRPIHVLIVEDSSADAKLVELELSAIRLLDLRAHWARSMSDAVAYLDTELVDVVLLDLSLPDAHGLDSIAAIKSARPQVPIVVLTGDSNPERGEQSVAMGAQDYMFKGDISDRGLERAIRYALLRASNDRLQRERQRQSARREQVEVIERLTAAIAHELNNALTIVRSGTELLGMGDLATGEREEIEAAVIDGVQRASGVADQLFALGGGRPFRTTRTDLAQVLETLVPLLGRVLGPRAALDLGPVSSREVEASQGTVERAVKLVVFAMIDHLEEARGRTDGREATVKPSPRLELSVAGDSGGHSSSLMVAAEPPLDDGQASALVRDATLRAVALAAGARLSCSRVVVAGATRTRLEVRFVEAGDVAEGPEALAPVPVPLDHGSSAVPIEGLESLAGRSVLVVEDEEGVLRAVARLVASLGLRVVTAGTADEAIARLDEATTRGDRFAAMVVDVRLAGTDGVAFVRGAVGQHGALPVVFMSGFKEDLASLGQVATRWELLPKPFSRRDMAQTLIRVAVQEG